MAGAQRIERWVAILLGHRESSFQWKTVWRCPSHPIAKDVLNTLRIVQGHSVHRNHVIVDVVQMTEFAILVHVHGGPQPQPASWHNVRIVGG